MAEHYRWDYDATNDEKKKRIARIWGCPLLIIPYWEFREDEEYVYYAFRNVRYIIEPFESMYCGCDGNLQAMGRIATDNRTDKKLGDCDGVYNASGRIWYGKPNA